MQAAGARQRPRIDSQIEDIAGHLHNTAYGNQLVAANLCTPQAIRTLQAGGLGLGLACHSLDAALTWSRTSTAWMPVNRTRRCVHCLPWRASVTRRCARIPSRQNMAASRAAATAQLSLAKRLCLIQVCGEPCQRGHLCRSGTNAARGHVLCMTPSGRAALRRMRGYKHTAPAWKTTSAVIVAAATVAAMRANHVTACRCPHISPVTREDRSEQTAAIRKECDCSAQAYCRTATVEEVLHICCCDIASGFLTCYRIAHQGAV